MSLQRALSVASIQSVALEGFKQLCMQGADALRAHESFVESVVRTSYELICSRFLDPSILKAVEVVVKFLAGMDAPVALKHVRTLSGPALTHLASISTQSRVAIPEIVGTLAQVAQVRRECVAQPLPWEPFFVNERRWVLVDVQIIRACDLAAVGETHLVLSVLEPSWQHLQALSARFFADAAVMERCMSLKCVPLQQIFVWC
jgi:hypothetical protein